MPKFKNYARIAITLPEKDLQAADRLARAQDRSRSWVIAEAVRRFAGQLAAAGPAAGPAAGADRAESGIASPVAEPASTNSAASGDGLDPYRLAQLATDMKLTPEQRVLAAEETLQQAGPLRPRRHQVLAFDRYEDFLDWKKFSGIRL